MKLRTNQKWLNQTLFFIDDTDIFNEENVSQKDRNLIMDLIDRTTFIADVE